VSRENGGEMLDDDEKLSLIEAACAFWFNDDGQRRSPIPKMLQPEVKQKATEEYQSWLSNLTAEDRKEVDDDELASIFEGFLFGEALKLVDKDDTDLRLTLHHPFMPKIGDVVNDATRGPSRIVERQLETTEDQKPLMTVTLVVIESKETWRTEFMLPP